MTPPFQMLVKRLRQGTDRGNVPWKQDDTYIFAAKSTSGGVAISSTDGQHPIGLHILDDQGQIVDSLYTDPDRPGPWLDWEQEMWELYHEARRQATGVNDIVKGIAAEFNLGSLEDLGEDIPF